MFLIFSVINTADGNANLKFYKSKDEKEPVTRNRNTIDIGGDVTKRSVIFNFFITQIDRVCSLPSTKIKKKNTRNLHGNELWSSRLLLLA